MTERDKKVLALFSAGLAGAVTIGLIKGRAAKEAQAISAGITFVLALAALT